jgi:hypothetical protein
MEQRTLHSLVQLGLSSDGTFFGGLTNSLVAKLLSGLSHSLVALTFN